MMRLSVIGALTVFFSYGGGVALLGCSAAVAQVNLPGMTVPDVSATPPLDSTGAPSPTGAMGIATGAAAIGGAGIPLATTELFAGGLSPAPTDAAASPTCPGAGANPGVGTLGTSSLFAGDGTLATSTSGMASSGDPTNSGCSAAPSAGAGPLGLTWTLGTAPAFTGRSVPLGGTALNTAGLAGTIGVPAPSPLSPCTNQGSLSTGLT